MVRKTVARGQNMFTINHSATKSELVGQEGNNLISGTHTLQTSEKAIEKGSDAQYSESKMAEQKVTNQEAEAMEQREACYGQ